MSKTVQLSCLVFTVFSLMGCNSSGEGATPGASAKAGSGAPPAAAAPASKLPELVEMKNEKRGFSFKVPKTTKADPGGDSYSWDTMQIMVEMSMEPVAKAEDMMKVVVDSLKEGAKIESTTKGNVMISHWKQTQGPAHAVCSQAGKSVVVRLAFEPDHKDIAMAICESLRIDK